ncbi:hypothetical protein R3P38DRAFT_3044253 [Favolaschia claudopus]|uniref:Uncharacterized protein n=1 Tax=Favolaschia claudopus TaxID=2862362 RepID=A0AAW0A735_9AGAR
MTGPDVGRQRSPQSRTLARADRCRCFVRGTIHNPSIPSYSTHPAFPSPLSSMSRNQDQLTHGCCQAAKAYTKHCEENGKPQSHAKAKEILAGLTGAFVDRIVETKGLDAVDKEKAKHEAHKKNEAKLNEHGGFDV